MSSIAVGTRGEHRLVVTPELAINFLGLEAARVLATPALIMQLEMTARDSIVPLLDAGFDSVGTEVHVRHLAATPVGMQVTLHSEVVEVNGRAVRFKVEAFDEKEKIADGTHDRYIVNIERFAQRLAEKRA
ncbi:MAG TPA: thioesterase family protein [Bryobacteraceae bacterium]|jgi:fluoroacetyl-CoA thioesterase|nr:thioesterase family protein [Bryobacteraceae bacterium]